MVADNKRSDAISCRYATSYLLQRQSGVGFEALYEAGRRGRTGEDCRTLFMDCNAVWASSPSPIPLSTLSNVASIPRSGFWDLLADRIEFDRQKPFRAISCFASVIENVECKSELIAYVTGKLNNTRESLVIIWGTSRNFRIRILEYSNVVNDEAFYTYISHTGFPVFHGLGLRPS